MNFSQWLKAQKVTAQTRNPASSSIQTRFDDTDSAYQYITWIAQRSDGIPAWGTQAREKFLRTFWQQETILSGAVHSAIAKIMGLGWTLSGGRNNVARYAAILREADGSDWGTFLSKLLLDYLTTDRGAFIELGSEISDGPVTGIFNLDSLRCRLTGNWETPVKYQSIDGYWHDLPRASVFHTSSLPSADVTKYNYGFCAVSRAISAAQVLILLNRHEREKLSDLPPDGIAAISGLTPRQFRDAMKLYKSARENKGNLVYPGILWLVGNPGASGGPGKVSIELTSFSSLPEQFDKKTTVDIYAKTLALAFGVDVNEFWQIEHVGATKASAWIQAQKAKGKFPAVIIATLERFINTFVLPPGVTFKFSLQDAEDRLGLAELHRQEIENINMMQDGGHLHNEEGRMLLIRKGILPADLEEGVLYVETDIPGQKIVKKSDGDYLIINQDGEVIFDHRKLFTTGRIEHVALSRPHRPSEDSDSISDAPKTEQI